MYDYVKHTTDNATQIKTYSVTCWCCLKPEIHIRVNTRNIQLHTDERRETVKKQKCETWHELHGLRGIIGIYGIAFSSSLALYTSSISLVLLLNPDCWYPLLTLFKVPNAFTPNLLHDYCSTWGFKVSIQKTKIMVFRKRGRLLPTEHWTYNGSVSKLLILMT